MGFLKRLLGGQPAPPPDDDNARTPAALVEAEQARERELLRADAERLDDELIQRQLRYAGRSWTPPAQGGTRRADDEDAGER